MKMDRQNTDEDRQITDRQNKDEHGQTKRGRRPTDNGRTKMDTQKRRTKDRHGRRTDKTRTERKKYLKINPFLYHHSFDYATGKFNGIEQGRKC
uniref:Uncharacterized protein n=1 Tax=Meloidogyne incognita TaxID=6306 RepID=A0A914NF62_MELIC